MLILVLYVTNAVRLFTNQTKKLSNNLCKINALDIGNMVDVFLLIIIVSRSVEILVKSNIWLGMYVRYMLENPKMKKITIESSQ